MTLGADWPTEELRDILDCYDLRILQRERRRTGPAPWWMKGTRGPDGRFGYDSEATWTETHYVFRREVICELCGQRFGYNFEVNQISRIHREGRGTDGSLYRELIRQLGRRVRCSHCGALQKEPRHELLWAERRQTGLACGLILAGILAFAGLGLLGGLLGGVLGFFIGLIVALACMLALWYYAFPHIMGMGPAL
jgi:hypothetical protein